jgi:hypothetical protein
LTNNRKIFDFQDREQIGVLMGKKASQNNQTQSVAGDMDASGVVGNRLFKIRWVQGYGKHGQQQEYAEDFLELSYDSYNQYELGRTGKTPVMCAIEAAIRVCEKTKENVTIEYIYRGRFVGMDPRWISLLESAPDRPGFKPPVARPVGRPPRRRG